MEVVEHHPAARDAQCVEVAGRAFPANDPDGVVAQRVKEVADFDVIVGSGRRARGVVNDDRGIIRPCPPVADEHARAGAIGLVARPGRAGFAGVRIKRDAG